ncbi:hypothetical protein DFH29DRAFT_1010796 [Suillus ampliporus]|nr:hypothetical protein DFH29DRAFT_1010796 [Suillus ampliporus]
MLIKGASLRGLAGVGRMSENGLASTENEEALHLLEHNHERREEESTAKLKEQPMARRVGLLETSRQYQMYRLHWLENIIKQES